MSIRSCSSSTSLHCRSGHGIPGVARKTSGAPSKRDHYWVLVVNQPGDDPGLSIITETIVIIHCNLADTAELRQFFRSIDHMVPKTDFLGTNIECGLRSWFDGYSREQRSRAVHTTSAGRRLKNKTKLFGNELVSGL